MHQDNIVDKLIRMSFTTWIKQLGPGVHIVFITDSTDKRSRKEIFAGFDKTSDATVRLFRTPAKKEGYRLRFKVIDSLRILSDYYGGDLEAEKKYFIKIGKF